jgi:hypothetical protein
MNYFRNSLVFNFCSSISSRLYLIGFLLIAFRIILSVILDVFGIGGKILHNHIRNGQLEFGAFFVRSVAEAAFVDQQSILRIKVGVTSVV